MTTQEVIEQLEEMRSRFLVAGKTREAISLAIAALKREAEPEPTYTPDAVIPYPYPDTPKQPTTTTPPDNNLRLQIAAQFMAARIRDWGEPNPSYYLKLADELIKSSKQ